MFTGVYTALATPFTAGGKTDFQALETLIEKQIASGIDGLVLLGTTAEAATMTEAEKTILQDMVNDTYSQFFAVVKAGRPKVTPSDLEEYTDGRVFTGQRAYNLGFIDKLGGEETARLLAGELAGLKNPKIITRKSEGLRELLFSFGSSVESKNLSKQLQSISTPRVSYLWVQ